IRLFRVTGVQTCALPISPAIMPARDARIVILTGAGISKESGLDTFRDAGGIWSKVRIEDVATSDAFARDPERVHAFYNMRRAFKIGRASCREEEKMAGVV